VALDRTALLEYFSNELRVDTAGIEDTTPLFSTGLVDSFAIVELLMFLEKYTGGKLGPEDIDLDNLDTIERILTFVARRAGEQ
jgi:acyl carrier protein